MWSNRSGWESCIRALFFFFSGLNNLQGRYLSLPSRGSFHEVWHDCCNVHMTFSGYMSSCQRSLDGFHYLEMGHGVIPPQNTSQSLSMGHTTGLPPGRHYLTSLQHIVYAPSLLFSSPLSTPLPALCIFFLPSKYQVLLLSVWAQHWGMRIRCWTGYWHRESSQLPLTAALGLQAALAAQS